MRRAIASITVATVLLFLPIRFARAQNPTQPVPTPTPQVTGTPQKPPAEKEEVGPDDVIRVKTMLVTSPVLVIGRDGKYVPALRQEDFRVFEDGVEQNIAFFAPVDRPITAALLIDTSRSTLFDLADIQDAAISFVDRMRQDDRALVIAFDDEIRVLAEATSERDVLRRAIRSTHPGGNTRVYDALDFVINQRLARIAGRKSIILFTDGVDTSSRDATYDSSLNDIESSDAQIYPIEFVTLPYMKEKSARARRAPPEGSGFSPADYLRADGYLRQVAAETGTALYPTFDINDLGHAVASIVEELHNEYSIGYYPQNPGQPGEFRRVEVRVNRPQLSVRARTGYVIDQAGGAAAAPRSARLTLSQITDTGSLPVLRTFYGDRVPAAARWMCKGPDVPSDFALVREGFDSKCPPSHRANDQTNAWFIRKPGASEVICKGFFLWKGREMQGAPIPAGYAVVGELFAPGCAPSNDAKNRANAWSVKLPGEQETVCKDFPIPRGYVVAGETTVATCPAASTDKNAWLITRTPYIETRRIWTERP